MHYLASIFIGIAAIVSAFFHGPTYGTTLTTLNGSDQQSNFPTTYNANNTAINNGKIDVGSTSIAAITTLANLSTVGTVGTGVWQGTGIDVARQGTGTTSPTLNQIMFGNGTSGFKVIGFGASGQLLTSAGAGVAPSWASASFDQTQNYHFTGYNILDTAYITQASSTNATTTNLTVTGNAIFTGTQSGLAGKFFSTTTPFVAGATSASSTIYSIAVPGNTLGTNNYIHITGYCQLKISNGLSNNFSLGIAYGTATTTLFVPVPPGGLVTQGNGKLDIVLAASSSSALQRITGLYTFGGLGTTSSIYNSTGAAQDSTASKQFMIEAAGINSTDYFKCDVITGELMK